MTFVFFKKTLLCLLCITGSVFSYSQFTTYNSSNSGLPYNTVRCVSINPFTNDVWAGTDYGLAKFDGTNWTVYNTLNSGLTDNRILSITTAPNGNLWVGTLAGGVFSFDGSNWTNFTMANSDLPDNQIKDIVFDQDGFMWIATTGGLAMYNGSVWTIWNVFNSSIPTNNVSSIKIASDNSKRIGAVNGGLQIISADNTTMTTYWSYNSSLIDNTILMIDFDSAELLWMATPSGGLIRHNGGDSWIFYNTETSDIPSNSATYILIDNDIKYIPTIDDGLIVYDGIFFENYHSGNTNLPDNYLYCIAQDNNGIMWMGSYNGGLVSFNPQTLSVDENEAEIISANIISGNFTATFSSGVSNWSVYDLTGKLLNEGAVRGSEITIPVGHLSGVFVFAFRNENGNVSTMKIFIP